MKLRAFFSGMLMLAMTLTLSANPISASSDGGGTTLKSKVVDNFSLHLQLINLEQEQTFIKLASLDGDTFFQDFIARHNGYVQVLNLEDIPYGKYVLTIRQDDETITQVVVKTEDKLILSKVNES